MSVIKSFLRFNCPKQAIGSWQKLRGIILRDELGICADLDAEMDRLIGTYEDEWKRAVQDPDLRKQFRQFVNTVSSLITLNYVVLAQEKERKLADILAG